MAGVSKPRLTIVAQGCELLAGPRLNELSARALAGFPDRFETTLLVQVPDGVMAPTHLHGLRIVPFAKYRSWKEYVLRRPRTLRAIGRALAGSDVLLAEMPGFEAVDALRLARRAGVPSFCLVVGEWSPPVGGPWPVRTVKRRLAQALSRRAARDASRVMTVGRTLLDRLRLQGVSSKFENRAQFVSVAANVIREVLCDYARAHRAHKRGGGHVAQLEDNLGSIGWSLDAEQLARLNAASEKPLPYPYSFQSGE